MNCDKRHCRDGTTCNHVTGQCNRGCDAGWTGVMCEKGCDDGTYGYDCNMDCSGHCRNDFPCNKQTGQCDGGCDPGYTDAYCSKSPKPKTIADFWTMIWQEEVCNIVCLTNLTEGTKNKCAQYWPDINDKLQGGTLTVRHLEEKTYAEYIIRRFKMHNKTTRSDRQVTMFHYTTWSDHGVADPLSLVVFHRHVIRTTANSAGKYTVVHCSAGVGRTGTYIALDALYREGERTGKINVPMYVRTMRKDRMNMIQGDSYLEKDSLISAQYPLPDNTEDFLRLIKDFDARVVVFLCPLEDIESGFNEMDITLLECPTWGERLKRGDKRVLLDVVKAVKTEKSDHKGRVLVMSRDGATRCGPFFVVYNVLEQISVDREVDIFTAVRQIQIRRPECVSTVDEYKLCHDAVAEYLLNDCVYGNC
uniref:protein-tyrosine-phosphatase n=1 Tax=Magallana gigas TaxID=29159 RepID=A0A8W8NVN9_MAGGI